MHYFTSFMATDFTVSFHKLLNSNFCALQVLMGNWLISNDHLIFIQCGHHTKESCNTLIEEPWSRISPSQLSAGYKLVNCSGRSRKIQRFYFFIYLFEFIYWLKRRIWACKLPDKLWRTLATDCLLNTICNSTMTWDRERRNLFRRFVVPYTHKYEPMQ